MPLPLLRVHATEAEGGEGVMAPEKHLPLDISQRDALLSDFEVDHGGCGEDVSLKGG